MGNQLSTETKTEFDGAEGDPSPPLSRPPFPPQSPEIIFSSQVPPSTNRIPRIPTDQRFDQSEMDMSSSPFPQLPSAMLPKQNNKVEIPESPDYAQRTSTPIPKSSKSKKQKRGNRPGLVSQPRLIDSDDIDRGSSVNGSSPGAEGVTRSARRRRGKKVKSRGKKMPLLPSPDLGNLEIPNDPIQSHEVDEIQETQQGPTVGFRTLDNADIEFTPLNASSKKRKLLGSTEKVRKKQKRNSNGNTGVNSATSFSSLAESLYAGRKKNRKALEVIEDGSLEAGTSKVLPDNAELQYSSRDSSASDLNLNGNGLNAGQAAHSSVESKEVEMELLDDSSPNASSSNSIQQDNLGRGAAGQDNDDESGQDKASDDGESQEDAHGSNSGPQAISDADATDERLSNIDESRGKPQDARNDNTASVKPKRGSARKRVAKLTFFEREAEGNADDSVKQASSSTGKKQAKLSAVLRQNNVNSPTPKKDPAKNRSTPKNTRPHELVTGQFSEFELRNITQAVERWRVDHGLSQIEVNDLIQGNPREVGSQEFWARVVATCPNRRRQKVINQCRRKFHNFVARGAWTAEQHAELKAMWEMHGSKYALIGKLINRHPEDVRDRIRNYVVCGESRRVDPWTYEEEDKLRSIISEAIQTIQENREQGRIISNEANEDLIDWQKVSERMARTRSRLQCIQKWKLMHKQIQDGVGSIDGGENLPIPDIIQNARDEAAELSNRERYSIVKAIRSFDVNADGRIPWAKVRTKQLGSRWTRPTIILAWYRLKHTVPDHDIMTVPEITKQLSVRYHETRELDYPDSEEYDADAEYDELERKIKKILNKTQRVQKTPATVGKSDDDEVNDDDDDEIADDDQESDADENGHEDTIESEGEDQEVEVDGDVGKNESKDEARDRLESHDESASSSGSEEEELPEQVAPGHESDDSADLENDVEKDEESRRESLISSPSISIERPRKPRKSQKRYGSSSKATLSRTPVSAKRKAVSRVEKPSSKKQHLDAEEELSSDTNASEVESIPAHL
ncbi:hypothetical protein F5Y11DRAFT_55815 [Daldinia sp. FL1419]|nr:hypothetical protein F5Y11DRAFT_55815 [Daldinia sp. FL1419]